MSYILFQFKNIEQNGAGPLFQMRAKGICMALINSLEWAWTYI